MSSIASAPRRVKPFRRAYVTSANEGGGRVLTLHIRTGRKVEFFDYYLKPIPCQDGAAYEVSKLQGDGETYHVRIATDGNTCECKGFLAHGHCKHLASLVALRAAGRI